MGWWILLSLSAVLLLWGLFGARSAFGDDEFGKGCIYVGILLVGGLLAVLGAVQRGWLGAPGTVVTSSIALKQPPELWQQKVVEWKTVLARTRERAARYRLDRQAVIEKLVSLGVRSAADVDKSVTVQTVAEELRDLTVDIELADSISADLVENIEQMESYVRRLERMVAAGGRDADTRVISVQLDGLEKKLVQTNQRVASYSDRSLASVIESEFVPAAVPPGKQSGKLTSKPVGAR